MPQTLDLTKPHRPVHVGVILMGGLTEIADVAPVDMIHGLSKSFVEPFPDEFLSPSMKAQALDFEFHWVSEAGNTTPSRLTSSISLVPTDSFETCPPLDIVLIGAHHYGYTPNEVEIAFVRKCWEDCVAFLTVCLGVAVPLQAGILEGKTATGPRLMLDALRQQAPATNWVEKRWVRDGKLWTSGALLNGTDLMHAFVHEFWGGGEEKLATYLSRTSAWPTRDVDYKDVPWQL